MPSMANATRLISNSWGETLGKKPGGQGVGTRRIRSDVSLMLASMFSGMGHFIISNQGNPFVRALGIVPSAKGWGGKLNPSLGEEGTGE